MADPFENFFKQHYRAVEARVRAAGASNDVAAEATQEAFVRAYQRWWRLSHYRNPAAWVQRVALNHRVDLERRQRRHTELIAPLPVEPAGPDGLEPPLEAAVQSLPARQQTAVRSCYAEGRSTAETAEAMGITPGAVRFHLNRARNALRPMLSADTTRET